ncbi:ADP-ribosylglycohydrolase family protein [Phytohabitans sp. ZYX-F-186]|uniref:ADP-ribosylglycohydrolase family protein n=1 Tax=Phytohabitans maris TaxID=3071409 RepID=A0ABU0ZIW4_9ACTN|nr:ADP-ribosylglycohydrolase family protein [Phytohabitans sp. ZYX-F-186]MDQ7906317.1 ADP-ribosylglycohydrolase family protein [Phytohabitans sp. ZYX-F-186]
MTVTDRSALERFRSRVRGCLIGGAVGDALGAPVEFMSLERIRAEHGPDGLSDIVTDSAGVAPVTDDTQMTLFTVEGLIRAAVRADRGVSHPPSLVHRAYLRWLDTQRLPGPPPEPSGWLAAQPWLYARRAPGNACLSGLESPGMGTPERPKNPGSKGCGTVMRSAPFGLYPQAWATPEAVFDLSAECATQTHGHPTGYLAAGAFAAIVRALVDGADLRAAAAVALDLLATRTGHEETTAALRAALAAADADPRSPDRIERLGGAWVAEEALAIGVYCALSYPDPDEVRRALLLSVNHSGDSDSTGSICGNLLGTWHGETALPPDWVAAVEGRGTILELADDWAMEQTQPTHLHGDHGPPLRWLRRYPA